MTDLLAGDADDAIDAVQPEVAATRLDDARDSPEWSPRCAVNRHEALMVEMGQAELPSHPDVFAFRQNRLDSTHLKAVGRIEHLHKSTLQSRDTAVTVAEP